MCNRRVVLLVAVLVGLGLAQQGGCAFASADTPPMERLTPDQFAQFLEGAMGNFQTIRADFYYTSTERGKEAPFNRVDGTWWWRHDGFERLLLLRADGRRIHHARTPDQETAFDEVASSALVDNPRVIGGVADQWGMPKTIFCLAELALFAQQIRDTVEIHGWEDVDGHRCLKFSVYPATNPTDGSVDRSYQCVFWLDPDRGAHPLQRESIANGKRKLLTRIKLQELRPGLWFPVEGRVEGTTTIGEIRINPESIAINSPLDDAAFAVALPDGAFVNDKVTGAQYYRGGRPRSPTPPPTQAELDKAVAQADEEVEAVRASSPQRDGEHKWPYWILGSTSALATIVGITILILRNRG